MTAPLDEPVPGVARLRLPMRFHPGHINSYLIAGEGGWLAVDAGNHSAETRDTWRAFLDSPQGACGLRGVLLTHAHPDHYGSAPWLAEFTGAPLVMAAQEWDAVNRLWRGSVEREAALRAFFRGWQASEPALDSIVAMMRGFRGGCPPFSGVPELVDDDCTALSLLPGWQLVSGFGHSPRNLMLWRPADGVLITGDQVLPSIVPNVSLWFDSEPDPLTAYLETLARLADMPVRTGLPAHGEPFGDFRERCEAIAAVHRKRLARARAALAQGPLPMAALVRETLGREPDGPLFLLLAGQVYALVCHLESRGEVHRNAHAEVFLHQMGSSAGGE